MTARHRPALLAVAVALVLTACTEPAPPAAQSTADASASAEASRLAECDAAVSDIVDATQRYVDSYSPLPPAGGSTATPSSTSTARPDVDFRGEVTAAQERLVDSSCDIVEAQRRLNTELEQVEAEGAVAGAVLLQTRAALTGALPKAPVTRSIGPTDDLPRALAEAPPGSTLNLEAGTYALDDTLVLLTGVTLLGAGDDSTRITVGSGDAAVLVLTSERVDVRGLSIELGGTGPGSVLVGGPLVSIALTSVRLAGGHTDSSGQGGAGVLLSSRGDTATARGTTLEVTGSTLERNQGAGIVLTGDHRTSVRTTTFRSNGQCGICFLDGTSGSVERSTFTGNAVGVLAASRSKPTLADNRISGGEVGVQASDSAAPVLSGNTLSGMKRAAIIYTGPVRGRIDTTVCRSVTFGIVLGPTSAPDLGRNRCSLAQGAR